MKAQLILFTAVLCFLYSAPITAQQTGISDKQLQLLEMAQAKGEIPVIVDFDIPFTPAAHDQPGLLNMQRVQITAARQNILDRNRSRNFRNVQSYRNLPHMALITDYDGIQALLNDPGVRNVTLNKLSSPHMNASNEIIGSPVVWDLGYTGEGIGVAVLDTGVDKNHDHFGGRVVAEACFSGGWDVYSSSLCPGGTAEEFGDGTGDDCAYSSVSGCGHGTHVAGTVAGSSTNSGREINGVAKDADIIAIQVFSLFDYEHTSEPCGSSADRDCVLSYSSDQIAALDWLYDEATGFNLVSANMSLGSGDYDTECDALFPSIKNAMEQLKAINVATIVSSGNSGYKDAIAAPACISTAVSVGSTQTDKYSGGNCCTEDDISGFSNSANFLDLLAPGHFIESARPDNQYEPIAGTSMAAPHVAGAWALYRQAFPDASVDDVLAALQGHGTPLTDVNAITTPRLQIDASMLNTETVAELPGSNEDWRMLGSPIQKTTYSEMFSSIWTQGFTGADTENGASNILIYDETTRSFTAPDDAAHVLGTSSGDGDSAANGLVVFVFEDDDYDGTPDSWPKPLNVSGVPNIGDLPLTLSRTEQGDGDEGWHIVSNPFPYSIDWAEVHSDATDIHANAYVWDPNKAGGADYTHTGGDWNGIIAPFQGFWVQALADGASLTFKADHKADTEGELYKEVERPELKLVLNSENRSTSASFLFNDEKAIHPEMYNAIRLASLSPTYLHLYSTGDHNANRYWSHFLPIEELSSIEIPLHISTTETGPFKLETGKIVQIEEFEITLIDHHTENQLPVDEHFSYNFTIAPNAKLNYEEQNSLSPIEWLAKAKPETGLMQGSPENRFSLLITRAFTTTGSENGIPATFSLSQNYPNPFNPVTVIGYQLPVNSEVRLEVFDMMGRRVALLVNEQVSAGSHTVTFNAGHLSSGIYMYRLKAGNYSTLTRKMTLVK